MGGPDSHDGYCRAVTNAVPCVVVSVDYRCVPPLYMHYDFLHASLHKMLTGAKDQLDYSCWLCPWHMQQIPASVQVYCSCLMKKTHMARLGACLTACSTGQWARARPSKHCRCSDIVYTAAQAGARAPLPRRPRGQLRRDAVGRGARKGAGRGHRSRGRRRRQRR